VANRKIISGFTVEKSELTDSAPGSVAGSAAQVSTPNAAPQVAVLPKRINVYLFDDLHLSAADLAYLKKIDVKALDGALLDSDMAAVVSTSGKVNSGLTRDRAKLHEPGAAKPLHGECGRVSEERVLRSRPDRE
jgi:hypothetical protein